MVQKIYSIDHLILRLHMLLISSDIFVDLIQGLESVQEVKEEGLGVSGPQDLYSPSGPDGPPPSGGSGEQPQGSAECNDCMQTPGGCVLVTSTHSLSVHSIESKGAGTWR